LPDHGTAKKGGTPHDATSVLPNPHRHHTNLSIGFLDDMSCITASMAIFGPAFPRECGKPVMKKSFHYCIIWFGESIKHRELTLGRV